MNGAHQARICLFDVDNTLYPRSSGLGRAMGDRIVQWVRSHIDLTAVDESKLPPAKEVDSSFNHPPDIDATDELVERLCLHYYLLYGLTIVGLVKHHNITAEQEQHCETIVLCFVVTLKHILFFLKKKIYIYQIWNRFTKPQRSLKGTCPTSMST